LAPQLQKLGGKLVLAEDELASINMVLGASYGGTPAMTVTSGPGFSLMTEALGLAVAAEIPAVLIDVMRSGPSTGIASKTEQSDINIAVYGSHGDAPRVVLAPLSVADCSVMFHASPSALECCVAGPQSMTRLRPLDCSPRFR